MVIDTDIPYGPGQQLTGLLITVRSGGPTGTVRDSRAIAVAPGSTHLVSLPASFGVIPLDNDTNHTFWLEVVGCGGAGCSTSGPPDALVTERAIAGFVRGQTLALHVFLADDCRGVVCSPDQTCRAHACVTAVVPTSELTPFDPDAGHDATSDLAVDATDASDSIDTTPLPDAGPRAPQGRLATAFDHACYAAADQRLYCWGSNDQWQLGLGSTATQHSLTAVPVPGLSNVVGVAANGASTCALLSDGTLRCFGMNDIYQLGVNSATYQIGTPTMVPTIGPVASMDYGMEHACAIDTTGQVWCWGSNGSGQLGDGSGMAQQAPVRVPGLTDALQLSSGDLFSCAVHADHTVVCWGDNSYGQIGDGSTMNTRAAPTPVTGLANVAQVQCGSGHACALFIDGSVRCWGRGEQFQLGDGTGQNSTSPVSPMGISAASQLTVGDYVSCVLQLNGEVWCWGANDYGQLGTGNNMLTTLPVQAASVGTNVAAISAGQGFVCTAYPNGTVTCWGRDDQGQLGGGRSTGFTATPTNVPGVTVAAVHLATDINGASAEWTSTGNLYAWGSGDQGSPWPDGTRQSNSPLAVTSAGTVTDVSFGRAFMCAVTSGGGVECWGQNSDGQDGNGSFATPTSIATVTGVGGAVAGATQVSAGYTHACALVAGGAVQCWGSNNHGQLGRNGATTHENRAALATVVTGQAAEVRAGGEWTCARIVDGTVQCWGNGALVSGGTDALQPVTILGLAGATQLSLRSSHACAVDGSRNVLCWGDNEFLQTGVTTATPGTAMQVSGIGAVTKVSAGDVMTCALLADQTVWCWGRNGHGQLGTGSLIPAESQAPLQVMGLTDAIDIAASQGFACALHANGHPICWGVIPSSGLGDSNGYGLFARVPVLGLP